MRCFLQEKLNFQFYQYQEREVISLPAPYGTDNFVYTIGASGVGKTYFFHGMEDCSTSANGQLALPLKINPLEADRELDIIQWKKGEQLNSKENYLISQVRNLCRLNFYEIEDKQITEDTITRWQSLQGYFERRLPCAIILIFSSEVSEQNINLKSYLNLVNLLNTLVKENAGHYNCNIPIYFIFNKSDLLLNNISEQSDRQMLNEFQRYLNSEIKFSTDFNFFSLRYQKEAKQLGALEIANRSKACCSNLAFITQLNRDLKRVTKIIDSLFEANFTNLSFIYTCSLFKEGGQFNDLKNLWSDLSNFIITATRQEIKKYYQQEFKEKLDNDFDKVSSFYNSARNVTSFEFSKGVFDQLNQAPSPQQLVEGFQVLKNIFKANNKIDTSDILNSSVIPRVKEVSTSQFITEKNRFGSDLDTALRLNLKELGIPVERGQIEKTDNQKFQEFSLEEIEFIDPKTINYYDYIWQFYREYPVDYSELAEALKNVLYETIQKYNENKSEDYKLKIYNSNLEIVTEQLPRQIQAIDSANRNKDFEASIKDKYLISNALSVDIALCSIQCGKFTEADRELIQESTTREQTVFDKLCQFADFEYEKAKQYCQLLSNYLPKYPKKTKYPQFLLVKRHISGKIQLEIDKIKIKIIGELARKLKDQHELLLEMIAILLKNRHKFKRIYKNISDEKDLEKLYFANYLLQILESQGFLVEEFQKNPIETIKEINNTTGNLIDTMESARAESEKVNLDSIRKAYSQITSKDKWLLNQRHIKNDAREIEIELKTASSIYTQILSLIDNNEEKLKSLLSQDIVQKFTFQGTSDYNKNLKKYERERMLLIIVERAQYLQTAQWVEDLKFTEDLKNIYVSVFLNDANPQEIKQVFVQEIDKLLNKEFGKNNLKK